MRQLCLAVQLMIWIWAGCWLGSADLAQAGRVLNDSLVTYPFRHHVWQDVLTHFVNEQGEVDFGKARAYPGRLNAYLAQLAAVSPDSDPKGFPQPSDKVAYWINAHNALAMRLILDKYPLNSRAPIPDIENVSRYVLGGKPYSLKQIREKLGVRAKQEPQLMFTLTDFTLGAPAIQRQAYEGSNLKTLERLAIAQTLADPKVVQVAKAGQCAALKLSPFFRGFERGLFAPSVAEAEDREEMEAGFVPVAFTGWAHYIRPVVPPAAYARLGPGCSPHAVFLPADQTLRQVRY